MFYRVLYCSRNTIRGSREEVDAEIKAILSVSRAWNEAQGLTGALIFNGQGFAQVLEGPRDAVDITYAKIRFDPRHSDVVLLEQAYQPERHFATWSMAYSDAESLSSFPDAKIDLDVIYANPEGFAGRILKLLRGVVDAHGNK